MPFSLSALTSQQQGLSSDLTVYIRWPKHCNFSFSISPSTEHSGLTYLKIDWFDFLAVQGTFRSLLQHHSFKVSIFWHSVIFTVQLLQPLSDHWEHYTLNYTDQCQQNKSLIFNTLSQFSSVAQSCPLFATLGLQYSRPPVHHQLSEFTHAHVHWVGDAIQPSHSLSSPSPPALNFSQHQGLFKWVSSLHQMAEVLEFQLQHQSFWWTLRTNLLEDGLGGSPCSPRDSQESSATPQFKSINFLALGFPYSPTLTSIHYYWKNHSLD